MRERHLDGTVLMRQAAGGVFEPLSRPDLLITDADRADVITSRRKDRDAALIGKQAFLASPHPHLSSSRYYYIYSHLTVIPSITV